MLMALAGLLQACSGTPTAPPLSEVSEQDFILVGDEVTAAGFQALSSHLGKAMRAGGPVHALNYCNTRALPLTDSIAETYGVALKRTALRHRNPANLPTATEKKVLDGFAAAMQGAQPGQSPKPVVKRHSDRQVAYYKPIALAGACVKCHGTSGTDIDSATVARLGALYPEDKATGFQPGDLRGMWVVEFTDPEGVQALLKRFQGGTEGDNH